MSLNLRLFYYKTKYNIRILQNKIFYVLYLLYFILFTLFRIYSREIHFIINSIFRKKKNKE